MKKVNIFVVFIVSSAIIFFSAPAFAYISSPSGPLSSMIDQLNPIGEVYGQEDIFGGNTQLMLVGRIAAVIKIALSLLGIIFVVLLVYAGYLWMTARGNEEQVENAQKTLRAAFIGLLIIMASYAFTAFLIGQLLKV